VGYSQNDLFNVITKGTGKMPGYADQLTEDQRWAVSSYVLSLAFSASSSPAIASTPGGVTPQASTSASPTPASSTVMPTASVSPSVITVKGKVTHVAGKPLPADLNVGLWGFDGTQLSEITSTRMDKEGTYTFSEVKLQTGWVYLTRVKIEAFLFNSDVFHASDVKTAELDLPISVYDTTSDIKTLSADRLHVFLDFSNPGMIQVMQLFIISNPGDRVVVPNGEGKPVLSFALPPDAENLQFQDGELGGRFISTENGFGDLAEIQPGSGQHQVLFSYELPFNQNRALTLESPVNVDAVTVIIPPANLRLVSDQLQDTGTRNMQGTTVQIFQASKLTAGSKINFQVYDIQSGILPGLSINNTTLIGGGVVLGLALILVGLYLYRRQTLQPEITVDDEDTSDDDEEYESSESIMDAIIALDDQYQSGRLPEEAYRERRAELKQKLRKVMNGGASS
jgi:hypothetical protein